MSDGRRSGEILVAGSWNASASLVAAVAGAMVTIVVARAVPPADYAVFALVWGAFFGTATIASSIEAEVARQQSHRAGPLCREQIVAMGVTGAAAALVLGVAFVAVVPATDDETLLGPMLAASAAVTATLFAARGYAAGHFRFRAVAGLTLSEAIMRLIVMSVLILGGITPSIAFAVGALFSAAVGIPLILAAARWLPGGVGVLPTLARVGRLAVGNVAVAGLITGAPLVVGIAMVGASEAETGQVQAAVIVSRFPLVVLALVAALLIPVFVRRGSLGSRRDLVIVGLSVLGSIPLAALVGAALGPPALALAYGPDYVVQASVIAALAAGAALLAGIQIIVALAVSADAHAVATASYPTALLITAAVASLPSVEPLARTLAAFTVGPLAGLVAASILVALARQRQANPARQSGD